VQGWVARAGRTHPEGYAFCPSQEGIFTGGFMPGILVRNLDTEIIERLKARAQQGGRSLQAEVKIILERSVREPSMTEFRKAASRIQKKLARRRHSDSTTLIREDRER